MKFKNAVLQYGVIVAASAPALAFAQTAQPDTSDAVGYLAAGVATILSVWGGKYIFGGVVFVAQKVMSAFAR